eukprot:3145965-Alexandrium_andersonii.AAC.1
MDDHTIGQRAELSALFMDPSQGRRSVVQVPGSPVGGGLAAGHVALNGNGPRVDGDATTRSGT